MSVKSIRYLIYSGRYHHMAGHSDDLKNIPRDKPLIPETKMSSVDLGSLRDPKTNLFVDQTLEHVLTAFF